MSAEVVEVTLHMAVCFRCNVDSEPHEDEDLAIEWAANHDAENHADYTDEDAADDAREHDRESRLGF